MTDLQALVDSAEPGADVHLPSGNWTGGLKITRSIRLFGPKGEPTCAIDSEGACSCIEVAAGVTVHLERLTLVNGAGPQGGGVCCHGEVHGTLVDVQISKCSATYFGGGGVYVEHGTLRVERCIFRENQGPQGGALLANKFAEVTIVQSLIVRNAARLGGGLCLKDAAVVAVHGVTIADNTASDHGSQIYAHGTLRRAPSLTIANTIVSPAADDDSGVAVGPSTQPVVRLRSSLLPPSARVLAASWADQKTQFAAPAFIDRMNYRLQPDSPGRGAGDTSSLAGAATDLAGCPLEGSDLDVGALQR